MEGARVASLPGERGGVVLVHELKWLRAPRATEVVVLETQPIVGEATRPDLPGNTSTTENTKTQEASARGQGPRRDQGSISGLVVCVCSD